MFNIRKPLAGLLVVFALLLSAPVRSQEKGGSVELNTLLKEMIENNPDVLKARQSLAEVEIQVTMIEDGLKPNISGSASYTRIGPVTKIDIPGMGSFQLYPADNYEAAVHYNQTVFDFGKSESESAVTSERKELLNASIDQLQQRLSIQLVHTYYQIVYIQNALKINDEERRNLEEHLSTVQKKLDAGTATKYAILSTQVRLSKLESKQVDLEALRNKELAVLERLVGRSVNKDAFANELPERLLATDVDVMVANAYQNRNELKIASEKEVISNLKAEAIQKELKPQVDLFASAGGKNGYTPELNKFKANFTAGVGLRVPIFDSHANRHRVELEKIRSEELKYETESTKRAVKEEVVRAVENYKAARLKSEKEKLQVAQAEEAYKLAEVSFKSGVITNLDLLDASTNLEDSKLQLLKTQIDYLLAGYDVSMAAGEIIYQ